ncbi:MAG TPA: AbrB/MazE/SpoVT family DNA-binding domain-containing protein [Pyrinomonadaceae bacterium]|nr:AbrB/MazE/SpoVT family DNA-binding domain-containing protein [Pyrinomonadaceae bacterium]
MQNAAPSVSSLYLQKGDCYEKCKFKNGANSLALRIPKSFAVESKVEQGTVVEVSLEQGKIVVTPVAEPEFSLEELLAKVTKRNLHQEVDTRSAVGKEV